MKDSSDSRIEEMIRVTKRLFYEQMGVEWMQEQVTHKGLSRIIDMGYIAIILGTPFAAYHDIRQIHPSHSSHSQVIRTAEIRKESSKTAEVYHLPNKADYAINEKR